MAATAESPFSEDIYRDQLYTPGQSRLLTNIPRVTATLSIVGSAIIIYIILKDRSQKLRRVYHRLLLAYSCIDVMVSFNFALSAMVVPKGTPGVWGAQGTLATCQASGFITQFSLSQAAYGCFICVYYVLVLRYQVREQTIAKYIEPLVHAFAGITPFVFGTAMILKNNYNPTNVMIGWCFINVYPMDCLRRDNIECQRGAGYEPWLILNNVPVFFFFALVCLSCILTYLKVRSLESRGVRWSFSQSQSRASERRVRETATQAALYILAFFFTYIFFGIGTLFGPSPATNANRGFYLPIVILTKFFLPLQGFFNCLIYIRPRFAAIRSRNPTLSAWGVLKRVLADDTDSGQFRNTPTSNDHSSSSFWFALGSVLRSVTSWTNNTPKPSNHDLPPMPPCLANSHEDENLPQEVIGGKEPTTSPNPSQVENIHKTHDEFMPESELEEEPLENTDSNDNKEEPSRREEP
jgi:hypothetical protein